MYCVLFTSLPSQFPDSLRLGWSFYAEINRIFLAQQQKKKFVG